MNVIVCVDNNMGVAFNNRRQSKDRILNEKILLKITGKLKVEAYSESIFPSDKISVVDDVLTDVHLDIDLNGWQLLSTEEFTGSSHEKITMEVWKNEKIFE